MQNSKNTMELTINNFFDSVILTLKESKGKADKNEKLRINANITLVRNMKKNHSYFTTFSNFNFGYESSVTATGFKHFDPAFNSLFLAFNNVTYKMYGYYNKNKSNSTEIDLLEAIKTWNKISQEKLLVKKSQNNSKQQNPLKDFLNISMLKNMFTSKEPQLTF